MTKRCKTQWWRLNDPILLHGCAKDDWHTCGLRPGHHKKHRCRSCGQKIDRKESIVV